MKPSLSQLAVMKVYKREEIVGGWATVPIPQVGVYKLIAKKRKDGVIEWTHFIQRDNGEKEIVLHGEVENRAKLNAVIQLANKNLSKLFGVSLQVADYDMHTLDRRKSPALKH